VLPAAVFALGHAAYSEPPLLKEAQILAVGCALGWARDRWGLAAAVAIHMAFNLAVVLVSLAAQWGPGV
jgi:membrane protease YdiL (CAAX protease family)